MASNMVPKNSAEAERERILQALMLADLGTARRDRCTTADTSRAATNMQVLESQRQIHVQGSAAQRRFEMDEDIMNGWNTLHENVGDTGHMENLPDIASGQSHRAALNRSMRALEDQSSQRGSFGGASRPYPSRGRGGGVVGTRARGAPLPHNRTTSMGAIPKTNFPGPPQRSVTVSVGLDPALNSNNDPNEDDSFRGRGRGLSRANRGSGRVRTRSHQLSDTSPFRLQKPQVQKPQRPAVDFSNKVADPANFMSFFRQTSTVPAISSPSVASTLPQEPGSPVSIPKIDNAKKQAASTQKVGAPVAKAFVSIVPAAKIAQPVMPKARVVMPAASIETAKTSVPVVPTAKAGQYDVPKARVVMPVAPVETNKTSATVRPVAKITQSTRPKTRVLALTGPVETPKKSTPVGSQVKAVQYTESKLQAIKSESSVVGRMGNYAVETPTPPPRSADSRKFLPLKKSKPKPRDSPTHPFLLSKIGPPSKEIEWKVPAGEHPRKKQESISGAVLPLVQKNDWPATPLCLKKKAEGVEMKVELKDSKPLVSPPASPISKQEADDNKVFVSSSLLDTANFTVPGQALQIPITTTSSTCEVFGMPSPGVSELLGLTFPLEEPPKSIDGVISRTSEVPASLELELERLISQRLEAELRDRMNIARELLKMPSGEIARFKDWLNQAEESEATKNEATIVKDALRQASFTRYRSPTRADAPTDSSDETTPVREPKVTGPVNSTQKVEGACLDTFSSLGVALKAVSTPGSISGDSTAHAGSIPGNAAPALVPAKMVSVSRAISKRQTVDDSMYASQPRKAEPAHRVLSGNVPKPHDPTKMVSASRAVSKRQTLDDSVYASQPFKIEPAPRVFSGNVPKPHDPKAYGVQVVGPAPYDPSKKYALNTSCPVYKNPTAAFSGSESTPHVDAKGIQPYNMKGKDEDFKAAPASSIGTEPAPRVKVVGVQPFNPFQRN